MIVSLRLHTSREVTLTTAVEGVMSGIISDPAFNDMFTATKDDNTMQATVTAVYEVGKWLIQP